MNLNSSVIMNINSFSLEFRTLLVVFEVQYRLPFIVQNKKYLITIISCAFDERLMILPSKNIKNEVL
jgi:hypothetical protein